MEIVRKKAKYFICIFILMLSFTVVAGCSPKPSVEKINPVPQVENPQISPETPAAQGEAPGSKVLSQQEAAEQFINDKGYNILMNSGANFALQFPSTFSEIKNGVKIGELLKNKNELSKQNGLDFSSYLGKQVTLYTYGVENQDKIFKNFDLIMDGNKVVGFWVDNRTEPPAFNVIVGAFQ